MFLFFPPISQLLPNSERHLSDFSMSLSQAKFFLIITPLSLFPDPFSYFKIYHTEITILPFLRMYFGYFSELPFLVQLTLLSPALLLVPEAAHCEHHNWCIQAQQRSWFHDTVGRMLVLPYGWLSSTRTKDVLLRPQNSQSFEEV